MRFDGDAALAFQVHRIQHLRHHFALAERAGDFQKAVGQRRFAVVDVRNNREIADVRGIHWGKMSDRNPNYPTMSADSLNLAEIRRERPQIRDCGRALQRRHHGETAGRCARSLAPSADAKSHQVFHVPGAFELPFAAKKLAGRGGFDAIVALGAVIRGEYAALRLRGRRSRPRTCSRWPRNRRAGHLRRSHHRQWSKLKRARAARRATKVSMPL